MIKKAILKNICVYKMNWSHNLVNAKEKLPSIQEARINKRKFEDNHSSNFYILIIIIEQISRA